jgi:SAM-dependent methyltransferase
MTAAHTDDRWALGSAYEAYMGRWSRALARPFLETLGVPRGARWLEVGCGTGALTEVILETQDPAAVLACEPAQPLLDHARAHIHDPRVTFHPVGSGSLPRPGGEPPVDVVVSSLVLNFIPDPLAAVREMAACTRAGGLVAAAVWDHAAGMELLRYCWDIAAALDPAAATLDEGRRFPLCDPAALADLFRSSGLEQPRTGAVTIETEFASFEDYWRPLLGGTGPAPAYVASRTPAQRDQLAMALRAALPIAETGRVTLHARAWTVQARVGNAAARSGQSASERIE